MSDFQMRFAQHNDSGYYFSNVRSGLIVGLMSIGTMIGALAASPLADRFGRKMSITFWCIIHMVGIIVQIATASKWYQVAVGRLVAGLGVGALSSLVPMYQSESAPRHVRGAMVRYVRISLQHVPVLTVIVLSNCSSPSVSLLLPASTTALKACTPPPHGASPWALVSPGL